MTSYRRVRVWSLVMVRNQLPCREFPFLSLGDTKLSIKRETISVSGISYATVKITCRDAGTCFVRSTNSGIPRAEEYVSAIVSQYYLLRRFSQVKLQGLKQDKEARLGIQRLKLRPKYQLCSLFDSISLDTVDSPGCVT